MTVKPQRSTLLTVLCILSFIGGALGIVTGAINFASASKVESMKIEMDKQRAEMKEDFRKDSTGTKSAQDKKVEQLAGRFIDDAAQMMNKETIQKQAYIKIGASILTLLGAILMFQLKSVGFYTYLAGVIIEIAAPLLLFGATLITGFSAITSGFISLIFVVLYAFCLKEMRPVKEEMEIQ